MALNYFRYDSWTKTTLGPAIPGAQIYVCLEPANVNSAPPSPLASVFSDPNGLVPITQPILTDGFGHADFYALPGLYTVVVAYGGIIQQVYPDQSLGGIGTGGGGGTSLVLENNGAANGNQLLLNLVGEGSVTVQDNGEGTLTIQGSSILLKTNGTANANQNVLNLQGSGSVSVSSDSSGDVTISASSSPTSYSGVLSNYANSGTNTEAVPSPGILIVPITVPFSVSFSNLAISVGSFDSSNLWDIGVYSLSGTSPNLTGTLVFHTGQQHLTGSNNLVTYALGSTYTMAPGTYLFAVAQNSGGSLSKLFFGANSPNPVVFSTSTSSSGVLPNTISVTQAAVTGSETTALSPAFALY